MVYEQHIYVDCEYDPRKKTPCAQIYVLKSGNDQPSAPTKSLLNTPINAIIFQGTPNLASSCRNCSEKYIGQPLLWNIIDLKDFFKTQRDRGDKRFTLADVAQEYGIVYLEQYNGLERVKCIANLYNKIEQASKFNAWLNPTQDRAEDLDEIKSEHEDQTDVHSTQKPRKQHNKNYSLKYGVFSREFRTKTEILLYYKAMLLTYTDRLIVLDSIDADAATALFGVGEITIATIDRNGNSVCFYKDGKPISYTKSIADIGHTLEENVRRRQIANFKTAAREAVNSQICYFKKCNIPPPGINHVDHYDAFFSDILWEWLNTAPLVKISALGLECKDERMQFSDNDLSESWQQYHKAKAKLQWLPAQDNIKKQPKRHNWNMFY